MDICLKGRQETSRWMKTTGVERQEEEKVEEERRLSEENRGVRWAVEG